MLEDAIKSLTSNIRLFGGCKRTNVLKLLQFVLLDKFLAFFLVLGLMQFTSVLMNSLFLFCSGTSSRIHQISLKYQP